MTPLFNSMDKNKGWRITEAEEATDIEAYQKFGDKSAYQRLIMAHTKYVLKIARSYARYGGISLDNLFQEGMVGLMLGIQHYDSTKGVKLITYAAYWVRMRIFNYIKKEAAEGQNTELIGHPDLNWALNIGLHDHFQEFTISDVAQGLNVNEKIILYYRLLSDTPETFEDLGVMLNLSKQRVQQIEARLKTKIKKKLDFVTKEI